MIGLIITLGVAVVVLIVYSVLTTIKLSQIDKNLTKLAKCFLAYLTNETSIDTIDEGYEDTTKEGSRFHFPNSEGF